MYLHKTYTNINYMLNNTVVSFYDNCGLIFKGSQDKATNGIENWWLSTTRLLIDASYESYSEYRINSSDSGEHLGR